jgi:hypothetical protein
MTQSLENTALVEVVRAVRWVGGERGGPGEKEKEGGEEKAGKGSETVKVRSNLEIC